MRFSRRTPSHHCLQPPQLAGSLLLLRGTVVGGFPAGSTHGHQASREGRSRDSWQRSQTSAWRGPTPRQTRCPLEPYFSVPPYLLRLRQGLIRWKSLHLSQTVVGRRGQSSRSREKSTALDVVTGQCRRVALLKAWDGLLGRQQSKEASLGKEESHICR